MRVVKTLAHTNHMEYLKRQIGKNSAGDDRLTETENILQFIRYIIAGCIATATHIAVFHIVAWKIFAALQKSDWFVKTLKLKVAELDDLTRSRNSAKSNVLAFVISNMVAYLINIYWVFVPGRHHWALEIFFFYLISGFAMTVGTWLMVFIIRRFGILTTYAFGSNVVTAALINFFMRKFVIFAG
jgi:putative flippase GtrA